MKCGAIPCIAGSDPRCQPPFESVKETKYADVARMSSVQGRERRRAGERLSICVAKMQVEPYAGQHPRVCMWTAKTISPCTAGGGDLHSLKHAWLHCRSDLSSQRFSHRQRRLRDHFQRALRAAPTFLISRTRQ